VAIVCSHCGTALRRDDARFCSHCGSLVGSHSQSSSGAGGSFAPVMRPGRTQKTALREQIPSQSASRPAQHGENVELVSHGKSTIDFNDEESVEASSVRTEVSSEDAEEKVSDMEEFSFSLAPQAGSETLVEVPDQGGTVVPESSKGVSAAEAVQGLSLQNVSDGTPVAGSHAESEEPDVEAIPTVSLPIQQAHISPSDMPLVQGRVQSAPLQPLGEPVRKRCSRLGLWLAVCLVVLLIVGVIGWVLFSQLAPTTDPWQRFSGTDLGFSVLYPTDWQVQIDHKSSIVHFYDSTQTDKVDIAVSNAPTSNVAQFLQQQASQLGITGITAEPLRVFAGTSWQQVQGKLSQEGVNYTVTLLAAIHGNRLYLLTQRSPQSTYDDEEGLVFSAMRAGWQFS
jgi:zinc-ribbon domain